MEIFWNNNVNILWINGPNVGDDYNRTGCVLGRALRTKETMLEFC